MTQLPNHILKSGIPGLATIDQPINYMNQTNLPQFVPTQQNTPLNQSMSVNGVQKPLLGKDISKKWYII